MQKVSVKYGCVFWCAWLLPTLAMACGAIVLRFDAPPYRLAPPDCEIIRAFDGALDVAATFAAFAECVCCGSSEMESVCAC
jgi:hypothetical protein